ncbi:unnamed protein product, partial [Staurois parvus]
MALGRKGLMRGDQRVNCVLFCCLCVCFTKHTALHGSAKQCAGGDREENCILNIQFSCSVEMQN